MTRAEKDCIVRVGLRMKWALALLNRLNPSPHVLEIERILQFGISDLELMLNNESHKGGVSEMTDEVMRTFVSAVEATKRDVMTLLNIIRDAQKSIYQGDPHSLIHAEYQLAAALSMIDVIRADLALLERFSNPETAKGG